MTEEDPIEMMERIRPEGVSRAWNPKGKTVDEIMSPSTVIMSSAEDTIDGKKRYFAFPTLFPKDPTFQTTTSAPDTWIEYEHGDWGALDMAREREEVFVFDTKKEADEFANGSWKPKLKEKKMRDVFNKMLQATGE